MNWIVPRLYFAGAAAAGLRLFVIRHKRSGSARWARSGSAPHLAAHVCLILAGKYASGDPGTGGAHARYEFVG